MPVHNKMLRINIIIPAAAILTYTIPCTDIYKTYVWININRVSLVFNVKKNVNKNI